MQSRHRVHRRPLAVTLVVALALGAYWVRPAAGTHVGVTSVTGSAFGVFATNISLFGGAQPDNGPTPTVTLPSGGGDVTETDPDGHVVAYGPATLFESDTMTVSGSGTTGASGSVTASSFVDGDDVGHDPFRWTDLTARCTAAAGGTTASVVINGGTLTTTTGTTTVPTNPAPNTERTGVVPGANDNFRIVFNEQSVSGGVLTVTAAHLYLLGPTARGDVLIGQTRCGVTTAPLPHGPVAGDDTYTTPYQTVLNVPAPGVLANDTGTDITAEMPTTPTSGTVDLNLDGSFTYTPAAGFSGVATFEYMVHTPTGQMDTGLVTVTVGQPPNRPPNAVDDAYATAFQTALTVAAPGVLANDTDPDAGDTLVAGMPSDPANGTVSMNADGSFTYTPDAGFAGTDTFTYMAHDPDNAMDTATVTVSVGAAPNRPPVADDDTYSTGFQTALTVAAPGVLANDTDPDGDALTTHLVQGPAGGVLTLGHDGGFTYTPNAGFSGADTFTYMAHDAGDAQDTAVVTITVGAAPPPPDEAPVANDDAYATTYETALTVNAPGVLANDTDANSDPLTAVSASAPSSGTVTLDADGSFTYTPATGFSGTATFTYLARDPSGATDQATVTITVRPPPPRAASADLGVAITDIPDPVDNRNTLTYTVTVANAGPDVATGGLLLFDLPTGTRVQSTSGAACVDVRGRMKGVACDLGDLAAGATATIAIVVTSPGRTSTITATATVSSATPDPDGANNVATEETLVQRF